MMDIDEDDSSPAPPPQLSRRKKPRTSDLTEASDHASPAAVGREDNGSDNNSVNDEDDDVDVGSNRYRRLPVFGEHKRAVSSVKFAPSRYTKEGGALVATASASSFIKLWDLNASTLRGDVESTGNSGDGEGGEGDDHPSTAHLNRRGRKKSTPLEYSTLFLGHSRGVNDLCWNPVSPLLASASDDKTVRLWDALTGDALVEFRGHDNFVFCVSMHHALLASGSFDETVKLFDVRSGECVSTLPAHSDPVTAVAFNRDGTCIASASHDGLIRVWDVATSECLKTIFAAGNPPVASVTYSPNGKFLLASTLDSCIRLWPVNKIGASTCAKAYRDEKLHVNTKYSVVSTFTHDGNVLTGSETGQPVLYDLQSRRVLQTLRGHSDVVLAVSAHDKLPLLCSGGMTADRKVLFWMPRDDNNEDDEHKGDSQATREDLGREPSARAAGSLEPSTASGGTERQASSPGMDPPEPKRVKTAHDE
jgi:COMPASS component SWD3